MYASRRGGGGCVDWDRAFLLCWANFHDVEETETEDHNHIAITITTPLKNKEQWTLFTSPHSLSSQLGKKWWWKQMLLAPKKVFLFFFFFFCGGGNDGGDTSP